ncbi:MAG: hypothetical protein V2I63_01950 [Pseudomonadales bacterium]|jgi:hypothetical protein|nr:hypothetical protein [Pseudomonadales bacterium]
MRTLWALALGAVGVAFLALAFRGTLASPETMPSAPSGLIPKPGETAPVADALRQRTPPPEQERTRPADSPADSATFELPASAWTATTRLQGRHAMVDFEAHFEEALPRAEAGDAAAMLDTAFAIENCHMAAAFPDRAALDALVATRPGADPEEIAAMAALIPRCRPLVARKPDGLRMEQWSDAWRSRAAEAGDPLAQYLQIDQWPPSDERYLAAVAALGRAVTTQRHWAYFEAADFVSNHPAPARDDPYYVEASAWLSLACRDDPACDMNVLERQIRTVQLPVYAQSIEDRAATIAARLIEGTPWEFDNGWRAPAP